ncbi:2-hydroxychromene-2-carboxylate isomerase [Streptomyces sp. NBC_01408]|uniref:2-hydroxychromene-2-carboxylate isomerase n=1 Tax=Streptomyces sp. NBC_01408 TaxID=2903855 RepID=UPI002255E4C7|nr:DsbA family protein [Streptomyces sp. NBC_01408]MCX4693197.1 DsbA family protein [Streptomyces sp. NBC_01408]
MSEHGAAAPGGSRRRRPPRFYFSLRSPYSWLAYRDLHERHPDVVDVLEWRPFWEPDEASAQALTAVGGQFPYATMSRAKHLYILQDVRRLTRERGLEATMPVDRDPCWEVPHLAWLAASDEGRGPEYVERVYRARWQEGRDICDPAVIGELAAELGLPADRLAGAAHDAQLRERGVAALLDVCRDGVFGVPFLIHGYEKFWGTDRVAEFAESVRKNLPDGKWKSGKAGVSQDVPDTVARSADGGHAGGCG